MTFDWRGRWAVEATEPGGGGYRGEIAIAPFAEGWRLRWAIDGGVGTYFGVGLAAAEGLYVACGPTFDGLSVILVAGPVASCLSAAGDAAVLWRCAATRDDETWRFEHAPLRDAVVRRNGEAHLASVVRAEGDRVAGLAWPTAAGVAIASGAPLERLVILFYPTPVDSAGPVDARWALGSRPRLGTERLSRLR